MTKTETAKELLKRAHVKNDFGDEYYVIDGQRDGEYKSWWPNGQLHTCCFYKNGRLDGEYKRWYDNGQLDIHCYYKNHQLNGAYESWLTDGQLFVYCQYKNGVKIN